jgi:predicted nuclease with TOPRIM domain
MVAKQISEASSTLIETVAKNEVAKVASKPFHVQLVEKAKIVTGFLEPFLPVISVGGGSYWLHSEFSKVGALRKDVKNLRITLKKDKTELRGDTEKNKMELRGDTEKNKMELKGDIAELKKDMEKNKMELKGDITELKMELKGDITELKGDMEKNKMELKGDITELKGVISNLDKKMDNILLSLLLHTNPRTEGK